jgi:hypothetical protein
MNMQRSPSPFDPNDPFALDKKLNNLQDLLGETEFPEAE